eukprot:4404676-Alexandrium_andersonii.AAC.1
MAREMDKDKELKEQRRLSMQKWIAKHRVAEPWFVARRKERESEAARELDREGDLEKQRGMVVEREK